MTHEQKLLNEIIHDPRKLAELVRDNLALKERVARLEVGLITARQDIAGWAEYASEYLQEKHNLAGDLRAIDELLGGGE